MNRTQVLDPRAWADISSPVGRHVKILSDKQINAYRANPLLVDEHANIERATAQGGYGRRQVYELVQNGADALIGHPSGTIHVRLTANALYCANEGAPIEEVGVDAILMSHLSVKRGSEIGRFGLGFKSVLGITNRPEFLSRSGSFSFDAKAASERIRSVAHEAEHIPVLRLAKAVNPLMAAAADPNLAELMSWATTVVKLPLDRDDTEWLREDLGHFPAEFLLFSPHVGRLVLEDLERGIVRSIDVRAEGDVMTLSEGGAKSHWSVFRKQHRPSDKARQDAGELVDRETLPVIWAVSRDPGRRERGQFWAFFPTEYRTTLSGILNAPWKTNEDRQNLLTGPFNEELLEVCANLVVDHLAGLVEPAEPGRLLDLIPARGREAPQWADEKLTELVYALAVNRPSIPNQLGELCLPSDLKLHPEGTSKQALEAWARHPARPANWAHPTVESRDRRARAMKLMGDQVEDYRTWLEALVPEPTPDNSRGAILIAGRLLQDLPPHRVIEFSQAKIVLCMDGELRSLLENAVFMSADGSRSPKVPYVHEKLEANAEVAAVLKSFGIGPADRTGEFAAYLESALISGIDWDSFWEMAALPAPESAAAQIRRHPSFLRDLRVRVMTGSNERLVECLLPGPIVPSDGSRDARSAIDISYHARTLPLLELLGATSAPRGQGGRTDEQWFAAFLTASRNAYLNAPAIQTLRKQPAWGYLDFTSSRFPGPIEPLRHLSPDASAAFVACLMELEPEPAAWRMGHATAGHYPVLEMTGPVLYGIRNYGRLRTSLGLRSCHESVGPALDNLSSFFPVAECSDPWASALELPQATPELLPSAWTAALATARSSGNDEQVGLLYGAAAQCLPQPEEIRARVGEGTELCSPSDVCASSDRSRYETLVEARVPVVLAPDPDSLEALRRNWNLRPEDQVIESSVDFVPIADEIPLRDEFPAIRYHLNLPDRSLVLIRCSELWRVVTTSSSSRRVSEEFLLDAGRVLWKDSLGDRELLIRLTERLGLSLSTDDIDDLLSNKRTDEQRGRLVKVRTEVGTAGKLLIALGEDRLRRRLTASLLDAVTEVHGPVDGIDIARLAETVYGPDVWHVYRQELEEAGFDAPSQWAGTRSARNFVRDLGLPLAYAGFQEANRDPLWVADGPAVLPVLHPYQQVITERIHTLVGASQRRGLLCLPTGAGKTRVAVEALVNEIREGGLESPVLWIAQTDELCEQAVQSWAYIWRAVGNNDRLSISRLWAKNEAEPTDGHQLVVATIAKLQGCVGDASYDWLSCASLVVIDEAHSSIGPSYTSVLQWLGLARERSRDRCPLIGLTATPYRGTNEEETKRLAARYNQVQLDHGVLGDEPYLELQRMGVLARVKHRLLAGSEIELVPSEVEEARRLHQLPQRVEQLLAADKSRNEAIVSTVREMDPSWPVLLFAASVSHAEALAAIFNLDGIPAAVVQAKTNPGARRHIVSEFRARRIRVLTNYGVLAEGFDAPKVQAVIVARPTYSPNAYQQMIGRGLRGPANGGTPECLVVNVKDNILNFGFDLAFTQFQYLWQ